MSTKIITPKNLRAAADILETQPFLVALDYYDEIEGKTCYCTMGAIAAAKGFDAYEYFDDYGSEFFNPKFRSAAAEVFGVTPSAYTVSQSSDVHDGIANWNDSHEDSPDEAASRLRRIADVLEGKTNA